MEIGVEYGGYKVVRVLANGKLASYAGGPLAVVYEPNVPAEFPFAYAFVYTNKEVALSFTKVEHTKVFTCRYIYAGVPACALCVCVKCFTLEHLSRFWRDRAWQDNNRRRFVHPRNMHPGQCAVLASRVTLLEEVTA